MTIMKHFLDKNFKYLMKEQVLFDPNYGIRNVSIHGMEEAFEGGSIVVVEDAYTSSFDGYSKYEDISIYVKKEAESTYKKYIICLLYTSPSPRDRTRSRMPSSA